MTTTKKAVKKVKAPLTVEKRLERIENDFRFLAAKLRTHGIHLDTRTEAESEAEPNERDEE